MEAAEVTHRCGSPASHSSALVSSDLNAVVTDNSCTLPEASGAAPQEIDPTKENQVLFTYSVHWEVSGFSSHVGVITQT